MSRGIGLFFVRGAPPKTPISPFLRRDGMNIDKGSVHSTGPLLVLGGIYNREEGNLDGFDMFWGKNS